MRYLIFLMLTLAALTFAGCGSGGVSVPSGYEYNDGWITTTSGLKYKDVTSGNGIPAYYGASVTVEYSGWLDDGTVFDSTDGRSPFTFTLGKGSVIQGWEEGVRGMRTGGTTLLIIPAELGYGNKEVGEIPANSTLHFRIKLISVE